MGVREMSMRLTYSVGGAKGDRQALGGSGMGRDGGKTQPRKSLLGQVGIGARGDGGWGKMNRD
jgi:hypothetical protein